ncbi:DHA2 family efflux MFS transporter permease subunit [Spirochaeta cellobiosiphila]|uniref:DHA2 family efflux MFS transporter permease subunit n=1 Tax=Spirochaeta cellobiosiphila TaxID=504483 RepID=UPI00040F690C|nr:DHA2 family efflux MFS transporter permease subunit [Spirochaeta cellobiosiphila]
MVEMQKRNENLMIFSLLIGGVLTQLSTSTVNIAIPNFMAAFNSSLDMVRWTITGFMLATGIIAPITCYLGERFSYKYLYVTALLGFTLSSVGCALATNIQTLILFRILQGIFNGIAMPASMSIIYQVIERHRQALAMSLVSFALTIAPAIGPTLSGFLIESFGWKSIFIFNIPIGLITTLLVIKSIPFYKLNPPEGFDLIGFITSIMATTLLLVGVSNISIWGWDSIKFLTFITGGLVLFVIFMLRQKYATYPILDISVFKNTTFSISMLLRGIVTMGLYAGSLLTPLFLQDGQGSSALHAGLVLLPASFAMAITTIIIGRIYNKVKPVMIIQIGILSMCIGSYLLSKTSISTSHLYIMGSLAFRNIGIAMALITTTMFGMASLDRKVSGNGSAINNWISQSIGCFSIGIFTSLLSSRTIHYKKIMPLINNDKLSLIQSINDIYLISVFIIFIGFLVTFLFKRSSNLLTRGR